MVHDSITVGSYKSADALPHAALAVQERGGSLFSSALWWRAVEAAALPPGAEPRFVVACIGDRVAIVLPLLLDSGRAGALTTPYTCLFAPAIAEWLDVGDMTEAFAAIGRHCRPWGVLRLDALAPEAAGFMPMLAGFRRAGLRTIRFDHFGNWHEPVGGLDWAAYLASRAGASRETARRRLRRVERLADGRFPLIVRPADIDGGIAAYEAVFARSWKEPEPYPAFNPALLRATAAAGMLRLGVWFVADIPVAVQFWVVDASGATVLKLAHDEAFKDHSPGTALTAWMIRHLLDREHVPALDFGRGDDPYKQGWVGLRRQRVGVLVVDPLRLNGLAALVRHGAGRVLAAVRRWVGR